MSYLSFLFANRRWLVAGMLLTFLSGFGQTYFISLSAADLRETFSLSHGEFGMLYMVATLCSAATLTWVGKSVDVFPLHFVSIAVMGVLGLLCVMMGLNQSVLLLVFIIFGLRLSGQGMMTHISLTGMGRWFSRERGRAVSVATTGFPIGESIFPLIFVAVAAGIGWRQAWFAGAILVFAALPLVSWLLSKPRQPHLGQVDEPEVAVRQWTRAEVMRDPLFYLISLGVVTPPFITTAVLFNHTYMVELRGWSLEVFAGAFSLMATVSVISMMTLGPIVDRYTARRVLPFMLIPLMMACTIAAFWHQVPAAFVFMAFVGASNGFTSTLMGSLWPELYGTAHLGAVRSLAGSLMVFASAAGPGLVGVLIDLGVAYDLQLVGMAIYCLVLSVVLRIVAAKILNRGE
ncbi:MAG: MFS transporter [Rhodobacteraceae bacterium]|nr:MFS transporter [Paracoccaceae bacterium]